MQPAHVPAVELPRLLHLIYQAAADATRWPTFLHGCIQAVPAHRALMALSIGSHGPGAVFHSPDSSDRGEPGETDSVAPDNWFAELAASRPEGDIWDVDVLRIEESRKWVPHPKLCGELNVRYVLIGVFLQTADSISMIVALRGEVDGPFSEAEFSILRVLMPHLRQAALLADEVSSLRARIAAFTAYLDRSLSPFLLTDAKSRVLYGNRAAQQTTNLNDGITVAAGRLTLTSVQSNAAFAKLIEEAAAGRSFRRVEVGRPSRKRPYRVLLIPVLPTEGARRNLIVLILDTEAKLELDPEILSGMFFLTRSEARVTAKLGAGKSAEEIAGEMGLSLQTVRTHIRRVLIKTATGRQGELIALALRTAPFCRI